MQKLKAFAFIALFGIAVLGLTPSPVKALVTYSYSGNNFRQIFDPDRSDGSFTTSMSVSGSFTVAAPLSISTGGAAILSILIMKDITASVLSFSFSDGRSTFNDLNTDLRRFFVATDNSNTTLQDWDLSFSKSFSFPSFVGERSFLLNTKNTLNPTFSKDITTSVTCTEVNSNSQCIARAVTDQALVSSKGRWTISITPPPVEVPEPSTLLLFGVGLVGLAGFARRRRQV